MERMALTDELTRLPNRAAWFAELDQAVAWGRRSNHVVAVMFMDLNGFKQINDVFGHAAGDEVLRQFGQRLRETCRHGEFIARLSGDEFVICAHGLGDDSPDPARIAERIHRAMAADMVWEGQRIPVRCSIGFAIERGPEVDATRLMEKADQAMYAAKRDKTPELTAALATMPLG